MKNLFAAFIFFIGFPMLLHAQSNDEAEVKAVINSLFDAMRNADSAKVRAAFAPGAIMQTIKNNGTSPVEVLGDKPEAFIQSIGNQSKNVLDEQITFSSFHSDGVLATVVTPYKFFYNGNFSHCGVNSFQLVKFSDGWKIQYIIDTRKKTGCN
ncbi:MAG: nuclear transport factor 2 family protein [Chitinophagaceae bacterium]|nr:nuclear transport factor 2 family protein [Chitinophagaceae bacterium]